MENYSELDDEFNILDTEEELVNDDYKNKNTSDNELTNDIQKELINYQQRIEKYYVDQTIFDQCEEYCEIVVGMLKEQQINDIIINKTIENLKISIHKKKHDMILEKLNNIKNKCQMFSVYPDDLLCNSYFRPQFNDLMIDYYNIIIYSNVTTGEILENYDQIGKYIEKITDKIEAYDNEKLASIKELREKKHHNR